MQLQIISSDPIKQKGANRIIATYNPDKEYIYINCDVDMVTLHVVTSVLQKLFDTAAAELDSNLVKEIKEITERVIQ